MSENLTLLVVDDEDMILDIFKEYLELTHRYTVFTASDGLEALDILKKEHIDCCFTDLSMPRLDGVELARKIHAYDNTIPVIVMTGYPSMDNTIETLKNGVVDFLTKPIKMDQIPPTIERIMRERSLFVDNILLKEEAAKNKKLSKINRELQQKVREIETINLIFRQLDQVTTSGALFDILVDLSGKVTRCDEAHFCIFSQETEDSTIITSFFRDKDEAMVDLAHVQEMITKKIASDGMPCLIKESEEHCHIIAIPLRIRSNIFGILISLTANGNRSFDEKDLYFLNILAEKASFIIENLALYENIYENLLSTLFAFVETIEARDPYTKQHSTRVTRYAVLIAKALGCSHEEIEMLQVSANLHDIGKIGIADSILLKPGRLTDEEYEEIKRHPVIGSNIIGHFAMWADEKKIIKFHHERWDGNGYPDGLKGEEIPFFSRILSLADVYDALTSDRSYRKRLEDAVAVRMIMENSGSQFDPKIVDTFLSLHERGVIRS